MSGFGCGDVVRLKSGGPAMTVVGHDGEEVVCRWFDNDMLNTQSFPPVTLERTEEEIL